jgi:midasin (ATPase involved in ribosome maturation)
MLGTILTIIQIFMMLPQIWKSIKDIMELIKLLRTPEEKKEARAELKAILVKYKKVNKKDKQQVSEQGKSLQSELDALKAKVQSKISF